MRLLISKLCQEDASVSVRLLSPSIFSPVRDLGVKVPGANGPCPEQGQQGQNPNSQLSSVTLAPILGTEPEDHDQTIHRVPVNGLIVILRFNG